MTAHAAATASSVFPAAIPAATGAGAPTHTLVRNAPRATPGHARVPEDEERDDGEPGGGPHERREAADRVDHEAEPREGDVDHREREVHEDGARGTRGDHAVAHTMSILAQTLGCYDAAQRKRAKLAHETEKKR